MLEQYEPNIWAKGDKASASKFNRLESAVANVTAAVIEADTDVPDVEVPAFGDPMGQAAGKWIPVFGDDFDEPIQTVDAAQGLIKFGDGPTWKTWYAGNADDGNDGHTNNGARGLGWYQQDQVRQQGSSALLYATYSPDASRPNNPFLTGMLESIDFTPVHGYFEARVKFSYVQGTWPAVWLTAKDQWPPEIDIIEQYGSSGDQKITTWKNDQPGVPGSLNNQYISWGNDWITVAVEWNEDVLIFYYDGVEVARDTNRESIPDRPMYMLLDMQVDADQTGRDNSKYPTYMEVDYYRAWQKVEDKNVVFEDKFANTANWRVDKGTMTALASGEASIAGVGGQWQNGLAAYLTGMPNMRDIDIEFDLRIPNLESYTSLVLRSDGTLAGGGGPVAAYGMVFAPHNGKWDLERFDYSGNGNVVMGEKSYDFGDENTWHRVRMWLNGGQMKAKMWRRGTEQPLDWEVSYVMGEDKQNDYVLIQAGKAFLTSLNGNGGEARTVGLGNLVIRNAGQPDPVPLVEVIPGDGGEDGGEETAPKSRYGAYTLSGATGVDNNGNDLTTMRQPVKLPKKAKRLRVHITNRMGLSDYNMPNGPSIVRATIGPRNTSPTVYELAVKFVQQFPAGSGSMNNGGEWVSGWLEPNFDTRDFAWLSVVAQFTGTDVTVSYSGAGWYANVPSDMASNLDGAGWVNYGVTPFNAYIEYEYEDDGKEQVLFIGDSIPEGYVDGGKPGDGSSNMRNWKGHIDSYPEAFGRHRAQVAVNNSYASAKINDWNNNSPKWKRFDGMVEPFKPGAVVIHLGGNDLFGDQNWYDIVPEMEQLLREIKARYPGIRTFIMGMMPLLATSAEGTTGFQNRVSLNGGYATIDRSILDGYIDPDNGLYDPASGANENIRPKYCSFDGLHLAPNAYELIAHAINI